MARGARGVDHILRLWDGRALVRLLLCEPGFEIDGEIGLCEVIGIDLVALQDFRRRRDTEHGHAGWDGIAELMQHVGVTDQHRGAGVLQDVIDLFRLEMPVDRHTIGAEPHRRIGRLHEGDVVAHQDANAVALLDAELVQPAGNARGAVGDLGVVAPPVAGDDAVIEGGRFHCLFAIWCQV